MFFFIIIIARYDFPPSLDIILLLELIQYICLEESFTHLW